MTKQQHRHGLAKASREKWKTNPKRIIEKYSSRNAEAKVDKLAAQKWTNWRRSEIGSSYDLK